MLSAKHKGLAGHMIRFTFTHRTAGAWSVTIDLGGGRTGGEAFDEAAAQYKELVPDWVPGHADVVITIEGVR